MDMRPENHLIAMRLFANSVRDASVAAPPGVAAARMDLYRRLVYANVDTSLSASFPVVKAIVDDAWKPLVTSFIATHRCDTPIYRRLPAEFVDYLSSGNATPADLPFLPELAHYEWVELELTLDPTDRSSEGDADGDVLEAALVVSPLARVLEYAFPVHRLAPTYTPTAPPPVQTQLVVFRDPHDEIRFLEINPLTHALLTLLSQTPVRRGREVLAAVARAHPEIDPDLVMEGGAALLQDLRGHGVIVGMSGA